MSCGDKAKNDMVTYTTNYDGSSNAMIRVSDVTECMKKGKDLVLSTDHTSLCGLFGTARWSSQVISPSSASLDSPDSVNGNQATWTFTCVTPGGVQEAVGCPGGSTGSFVTNRIKCDFIMPNGRPSQTIVVNEMLNNAQ